MSAGSNGRLSPRQQGAKFRIRSGSEPRSECGRYTEVVEYCTVSNSGEAGIYDRWDNALQRRMQRLRQDTCGHSRE